MDHAGTFIRTIQYKGRTASLIIKVQQLSGVQKQVSSLVFMTHTALSRWMLDVINGINVGRETLKNGNNNKENHSDMPSYTYCSHAPEHLISAVNGPDDDGDGSDPLVFVFYKSC